jgi:hypothetical protein
MYRKGACKNNNYIRIDKYLMNTSRKLGKGACGEVYLGTYAPG